MWAGEGSGGGGLAFGGGRRAGVWGGLGKLSAWGGFLWSPAHPPPPSSSPPPPPPHPLLQHLTSPQPTALSLSAARDTGGGSSFAGVARGYSVALSGPRSHDPLLLSFPKVTNVPSVPSLIRLGRFRGEAKIFAQEKCPVLAWASRVELHLRTTASRRPQPPLSLFPLTYYLYSESCTIPTHRHGGHTTLPTADASPSRASISHNLPIYQSLQNPHHFPPNLASKNVVARIKMCMDLHTRASSHTYIRRYK